MHKSMLHDQRTTKNIEKMVLKFKMDSTELRVESVNGEVTWSPAKPDSISDEVKAELDAAGIKY